MVLCHPKIPSLIKLIQFVMTLFLNKCINANAYTYGVAFLFLIITAPSALSQKPQTVIFEPPLRFCIDDEDIELEAESFDFEGDAIRVMSFNIHTGIGGYAATTSGGISTQYTEPELWPLIIPEIAERIFQQNLDIFGLQEVIGGQKTVNDGRVGRRDSEQSEIIKTTLNNLESEDVWDYQFWTHNIGLTGSSGGDWWGVATFYRSPWTLVGDPSIHSTSLGSDIKSMIKTTLTNSSRTIDVFTAHFDVDLPEPADGSIQYSELNAAPALAAANNPVILIGDLNVEPQHKMPDGTLQLQPLWDIGLMDSAVSSGVVPRLGFGPGPDSLHTRQNVFGESSKRIDWVVHENSEFIATGVEVYHAQDDPSTTMPSPHPSIAAGANRYPEQQATSYISDHHAFIADLKMRGNLTGLPITYSSSNPDVATVSGSTLTIVGTGSTNLLAEQTGNEVFAPTTSSSRQISVSGLPVVLLEESFETDGDGTRYNIMGAAITRFNAYFHRSSADGNFASPDGDWYFSAENIDGQGGYTGFDDGDALLGFSGMGAVVFDPLPITGLTGIEVTLLVAASDPGGFDNSMSNGDKMAIQASIDNGPFEEIGRLQSSVENGPLISPEETPIGNMFSKLSFLVNATGNTLQLRIVLKATSGAGNEILGFDKVTIIGGEAVLREDIIPLGGACNPILELEDWFQSPWFGDYNTSFQPWIYHPQHKFTYISPLSDRENIFLYDPVIGIWIYTNRSLYPILYFFDDQGWMFFFDKPAERRAFFRYSDSTVIFYD